MVTLYHLLCTAVVVSAYKGVQKLCDYTSLFHAPNCYRKQVIVSMPHSPNQIAVDRRYNILYFSFDNGVGQYIPASVKLGGANRSRTVKVLKGVRDAFSMAYDDETAEMYFGGSHGIYRFNKRMKKLRRLALTNLDIWWLVLDKSGMYFVKFPSMNAFRYDNRSVAYMPELKDHSVHQFVFDSQGDIFFINMSGLYRVRTDEMSFRSNEAVFYQERVTLVTNYPKFLGMTTDAKGDVYVCNEDGIFHVTRDTITQVKRVINVHGAVAIAFNSQNNIIYSDSHDLALLTPVTSLAYDDQQ